MLGSYLLTGRADPVTAKIKKGRPGIPSQAALDSNARFLRREIVRPSPYPFLYNPPHTRRYRTPHPAEHSPPPTVRQGSHPRARGDQRHSPPIPRLPMKGICRSPVQDLLCRRLASLFCNSRLHGERNGRVDRRFSRRPGCRQRLLFGVEQSGLRRDLLRLRLLRLGRSLRECRRRG